MKLFNNLHNIILEQSTPWHEKVFQSEDHESLWPLIKLFGSDIHEMYKALDSLGKGEDFLKHISHNWPYDDQPLRHIIDALGGMRDWNNGKMDNDLVNQYVIDIYLDDMRYIGWGNKETGFDKIFPTKDLDRILIPQTSNCFPVPPT